MKEENYPAVSEQMSAAELCSYLEERHQYYNEQLLGIHVHLNSAAKIDGDKFPVYKELAKKFDEFKIEFENHMRKERQLIYPLANENKHIAAHIRLLLEKEIVALEQEHQKFEEFLDMLRTLTAGYSVDPGCSPTCKLCMLELKEVDTDIKKLMSIEEEKLFPLLLL